MNDFTKKELKNIVECIQYTYLHESISPEIHLFLRKKIQSMIDNYFEHEWHSGGNRPWLHCIKCKSNFNHEPSLY